MDIASLIIALVIIAFGVPSILEFRTWLASQNLTVGNWLRAIAWEIATIPRVRRDAIFLAVVFIGLPLAVGCVASLLW